MREEDKKEQERIKLGQEIIIPSDALKFLEFSKKLTEIADDAAERMKRGELVDVFSLFSKAAVALEQIQTEDEWPEDLEQVDDTNA